MIGSITLYGMHKAHRPGPVSHLQLKANDHHRFVRRHDLHELRIALKILAR